jgi:carbon storage regulator
MLIFTRRPMQRILIGDDVVVEIVRVRGNQVRFRIVAPKDVKILRAELKKAQRKGSEEDYSHGNK